MVRWTPCKRREFIKKLKALGFESPEPGGKHFYMRHGEYTLTVPNNEEFSVPQLKMLLKQVEDTLQRRITLAEWNRL